MPGPTPPPGHGLDWFTRSMRPPAPTADSLGEARTELRLALLAEHWMRLNPKVK